MGSFSWMYANSGNEKPLNSGNKGYLYCPNGSVIEELDYEGYGVFDGNDVYDLVADWNREYLSKHPEFLIYQGNQNPKRIDSMPWYKFYQNLNLSRETIVKMWIANDERTSAFANYRDIGIDIACGIKRNAWLPFPIKIASRPNIQNGYEVMPPSKDDPNQGFGRSYAVERVKDEFVPIRSSATTRRCPNCGGNTFVAKAHLIRDCSVDAEGRFLTSDFDWDMDPILSKLSLVSPIANGNDVWRCKNCGLEKTGDEFIVSVLPAKEDRYTLLVYDDYLPFVKGLPGLPCNDSKAKFSFTSKDLVDLIQKLEPVSGNVCAVRDNLKKVAVTVCGEGENTSAVRLSRFLHEATDEKRGKYCRLAVEDERNRLMVNDSDFVSVCISDFWGCD